MDSLINVPALKKCILEKFRLPNINVNIGWQQSQDYEDGIKYAHDEITFRSRSGDTLDIPQAERYSTKDWVHNLWTMKTSRLLKRIRGVIIFNTFWSAAVYIFHLHIKFNAPGSRAHALLGSALGLLLVFRTNTAYNRFWEGRKIWERLLSNLRDMGRMTLVYADVMSDAQVERILHLLCAFPLVLQEHVQGFRQPEALRGLLKEEEILKLGWVSNRPFYIANKLAKEIRTIPETGVFTPRERQMMYKYVDEMSRSIGCCERIVQTPVPLTYARHTSRFLSLWCLTLPVALVTEIGWHIIPFSAFVSWSLFGIQEIGMTIEEPFQRALKLEVFANTIRRDLADLLHVTDAHPQGEPIDISSPALSYIRPAYQKARHFDSIFDSIKNNSSNSAAEIPSIDENFPFDFKIYRDLEVNTSLLNNDPMEIAL